MIDWGSVPKGSVASIYWPAVSAAGVIALARQQGSKAPISASDAHTLSIPIDGGISYIPIPSGAGQNFAGLFTLEMPQGIRTGQEFEVVVRRISAKRGRVAPSPRVPAQLRSPPTRKLEKPRKPQLAALQPEAVIERPISWRYVVGSFVVRVPVSTGERMRVPEAMTLAIMKWRQAHLSPGNRWAPVLERYIKYCSARLDGIGGDSSQVPASLTWIPPLPGEDHRPRKRELCGKVAEVLFDCNGEFDGFMLDSCCERHLVKSRERGVAEVILRACHESLTVCVKFCSNSNRIESLAIRT